MIIISKLNEKLWYNIVIERCWLAVRLNVPMNINWQHGAPEISSVREPCRLNNKPNLITAQTLQVFSPFVWGLWFPFNIKYYYPRDKADYYIYVIVL